MIKSKTHRLGQMFSAKRRLIALLATSGRASLTDLSLSVDLLVFEFLIELLEPFLWRLGHKFCGVPALSLFEAADLCGQLLFIRSL
jgi:hypothetical protein